MNRITINIIINDYSPKGGGAHIGTKPEIKGLSFDDEIPRGGYHGVGGLQTPPRTLTLDEQFGSLERQDLADDQEELVHNHVPNGYEILIYFHFFLCRLTYRDYFRRISLSRA